MRHLNKVASVIIPAVLLFIAVASTPSWKVKGHVELGRPYYFTTRQVYWGEITQVMATETFLYVLYDAKQVLECYDLDGNYLCSYGFWFQQNGQAALGSCADNKIYLEDPYGNIYLFDGITYLTFLNEDTNNDEIELLSCSPGGSLDSSYAIRWASIYRKNFDGTWNKIIHRPFVLFIFQHGLFAILGFLILLVAFLIDIIYKKK